MFGLSKPEKKILVPVLSILIGLCTLAYFAHRYSQRLIIASELIEQGEEILHHTNEVLSITLAMETDLRGYVLTGDESFLAPAHKSYPDLIVHLHQLRSAAGFSPDQKLQIESLQKLIEEKSTFSARIIELRRQRGMAEAISLIEDGQEKAALEKIRSLTGKLFTEEDAQLTKLKAEQHRANHHFAWTFYFLLLKIAITVITVLTLLVLYFRRRNKSEKLLKETKELFHHVLDHTSAIISIKDLSGRFMLINKAYEQTFGIKEDSLKGKTVYDLFSKDIAESIRHADMEVIKTQHQVRFEESAPVEGETRHFISLKFPLFDAHQIPYAVCGISTDETEKIQTEQQHLKQMTRILDLFNNVPCGYQATDQNGIIVEINETLLKWLGYTREKVVGKMVSKNLISKESQHLFTHYFPRLRTGELTSIFDVEVIYLRKDGSKLPIVANTIAQYDEAGEFMYTRTSVFDSSYRKRVEDLVTHN